MTKAERRAGRSIGMTMRRYRFHVEAPSRYVQRRQRWILRQMSAIGGRSYLVAVEDSTHGPGAP